MASRTATSGAAARPSAVRPLAGFHKDPMTEVSCPVPHLVWRKPHLHTARLKTGNEARLHEHLGPVAHSEHGLTLATGHVTPAETLMIMREARRQGVERIIVTHPLLIVASPNVTARVRLPRVHGWRLTAEDPES